MLPADFVPTVIPPVRLEINEASSLIPHFQRNPNTNTITPSLPTTPSSTVRHPYPLRTSQTTPSSSPSPPAVNKGALKAPNTQFVVAVLDNSGFDPSATAAASPAPSPASFLSHGVSLCLALKAPSRRCRVQQSCSHRALQCLATASSGFQARLQSAATASQPRR
ncbi:hypothetical protein PIB30_025331 [Stylosanthes scabra]|uniref:Uncharacterized protein n=1 Tax=Stylosanthes scabra TaxID=79078 RepID=A0ABU6XAW8_9FABA|nr:hypothetical protein [Stylosanthes scabra]